MSIQLMSAAWRLNIRGTGKLIMLALCDWANDEGGSLHPSMVRIAQRASVDERSARRVMSGLIRAGWVRVVGNHNGGRPGATRRYQLNVHAILDGELSSSDRPDEFDPEQTGDKPSQTAKTRRGATDAGRGATDTDTGGSSVPQSTIDPSVRATTSKSARARARAAYEPDRPADVSEGVWIDWLTLRRAKSAPVTETVLRGARREAAIAGMGLEDFLSVWCERGTQGLRAEWLRPVQVRNAKPDSPRPMSAAERVRTANAAAGFFDGEGVSDESRIVARY